MADAVGLRRFGRSRSRREMQAIFAKGAGAAVGAGEAMGRGVAMVGRGAGAVGEQRRFEAQSRSEMAIRGAKIRRLKAEIRAAKAGAVAGFAGERETRVVQIQELQGEIRGIRREVSLRRRTLAKAGARTVSGAARAAASRARGGP